MMAVLRQNHGLMLGREKDFAEYRQATRPVRAENTGEKERPMKRKLALVSLAVACVLLLPSFAQAGYRDGMSLYEYVGSGPVSHRDPSGLVRYDEVDRALDDAEFALGRYRKAFQEYRSRRMQGANVQVLREMMKGLEKDSNIRTIRQTGRFLV